MLEMNSIAQLCNNAIFASPQFRGLEHPKTSHLQQAVRLNQAVMEKVTTEVESWRQIMKEKTKKKSSYAGECL